MGIQGKTQDCEKYLKFPALSSLNGCKRGYFQSQTWHLIYTAVKGKAIPERKIDNDIRKKMRGRAKIRTNNRKHEKRGFTRWWEKGSYSVRLLFSVCSLVLSHYLSFRCLSAVAQSKNISSHFTLTLQLYLCLFIFVISFSVFLLCRCCRVSVRLCLPVIETKEQHVSFVFYSSLWHQTITKEFINIPLPGIQSQNSIHTHSSYLHVLLLAGRATVAGVSFLRGYVTKLTIRLYNGLLRKM